ncbi:MAG TPA: UDP-3-O-(3-hydroxymyristoyl)glucosamine N-acyltransferase [Gemmataceae bacterium]|nr:UDP-3-O-(3-hydroxymyristoyl)glucosamine N-acyltransferase [Gemmataceae bacterium]
MTLTVRDLAELVQGEVVGDPAYVIRAARPLSDAPKADEITVILHEKYIPQFHASAAGAAVVDQSVPLNGKTMVRVKDPLLAFVTIVQKLHVKPATVAVGVHPSAVVHPTATLGPEVSIGPHVSIGEGSVIGARCHLAAGVTVGSDCKLGDDVALGPNVVIYDRCILGHRVIIHGNAVIGADGFGFRTIQGKHVKVPQVGNVEIGDDVEIGACTTIDRATFGTTRIGVGSKIDNLVQIAHNCQIGKHNIFAAQVGIAGSVTTGDYVVMAGQVGIADHCRIGDRTMLGAKSGVHSDIPSDQKMLGAPATPVSEQLRILSSLEKLPEMRKDIRELKKHLRVPESG